LTAYDAGEGSRAAVAHRFRVSLGLVKKLLQQRRRIGEIGAQHHRSGRKPSITAQHQQQFRALLARKPDLTLKELRQAVGLDCTLPAIHYVLDRLGLTYKKRHSGPASRIGRASSGRAAAGGGNKAAGTRLVSSFSTNPGPRRT
jgi:transposase